jgi:hypothetical protein
MRTILLNSTQSKVKFDGENAANYDNREYDELYDEMKNLSDGPQRQALIDKMVKIVQNDAVWMFGIFPGATGVYQTWVKNAKPSLILKDQARYLRIDAPLRAAKIAEWNQPRPWPIVVFIALAALVVWPAWRLWQRRERTTARGQLVEVKTV